MTVGEFREYLLSHATDGGALAALAPGTTPEIAAAVSKLMRDQDLILAARKCRVVTRFRNTLGLPGTMAVRLQPNHPTDDVAGIMAAIADGLRPHVRLRRCLHRHQPGERSAGTHRGDAADAR